MLYLALSIACSLAVAAIIKTAGVRTLHLPALLTSNYLVAALLAIGLVVSQAEGPRTAIWSPDLIGLGLGTGVVFIAGFFAMATATRLAGMSAAVSVMRVSIIIPVTFSWLVWAEQPTGWQGLGLGVAALSIVGLAHQPKSSPDSGVGGLRAAAALAGLFLLAGLSDTSLKLFEEEFAGDASRAAYMTLVFGMAGAVGALWLLVTRGSASGTVGRGWAWGAALGLANMGSVEFMLQAIARLPGPVAFPVNGVAIMLGATVMGIALWRERLTPYNKAGFVLASASIILLGL